MSIENIEFEESLKLILISWNHLCDVYEKYPICNIKLKNIKLLIEQIDCRLINMIEDLKLNFLDEVLKISLELAREANLLLVIIIGD